MNNIYEVRSANQRKSLFVIVGFTTFVALAVYILTQAFSVYLGYQAGMLGIVGIALVFSGLTSFISYYYSDRIVLGISGAKEAGRDEHFDFYTAAENLSLAANIPTPKLYVINDSAPNAFATGRDPEHAVVCTTTGLLAKLNRTELEGVIAHELTHITNYDTRLMTLVTVMVGVVALLGDMFLRMQWFGGRRDRDSDSGGAVFLLLGILFAIFAPIVATLIKLAISRRREYMADAGAVSLTRQPSGLISALQKISGDKEALEAANKATAHLYIINPFQGKADKRAVSKMASLFNTHPPVEQRIHELKKMI